MPTKDNYIQELKTDKQNLQKFVSQLEHTLKQKEEIIDSLNLEINDLREKENEHVLLKQKNTKL